MSRTPDSSHSKDIAYHLHPFTDLVQHEEQGPHIIARGSGITVTDDAGRQYIEGLSGLWCTSLGYGEERLVQAATKQLRELAYYHGYSSRSTWAAIELAERLIKMAPSPMSKAFFTNSGSEANDAAVRIVWYYNNALDRPRKKKIIARHGAYHGVTVAALSLTGVAYATNGFDVPIANVVHTDCPHFYRYARPQESEEAFATRMAENLESLILSEGPDTVAAFIAEPVMGAGGVITPPATYFERIQDVLRRYDVLLIADEVICGFGRTGNMFGTETYGLKPDIMTMAKALSSAYLPIGAVLISEPIYQALLQQSRKFGLFGTGHTYSGHPVCAAVALETLKIYEERNILEHVRRVAPRMQERLYSFSGHPLVGEVRGVGLIGAIQLVGNKQTKEPFDPALKVAAKCMNCALEHGLITRALVNDSLAFCPALVVTEAQIDEIFDRFGRALDETQAWLAGQKGQPFVTAAASSSG